MMLWVGCEADTVSDDADAGPAGAAGSGAAAGAAGAAGASGAGNDAGNGAGTQGGAAGTGGLSTECEAIPQMPAECNECLQANCQQPCADMQNHPEAEACNACAEACTDAACSDACYAECPGYVEAGETFVACMEEKCCETCSGCVCTPCLITTNDDECDACMYEACLDACVSLDKLGVTEYFQCQNECEDDACLEDCDAAHPEVAIAFDELLECTLTACPAACEDVLSP
jgi:hypothetical protein